MSDGGLDRSVTSNRPAQVVERIASAGVALAGATLLAVSATLTPSPRGFGTHLQLGLGPCSFLALTGYPCPVCGATTAFALMAHLRPWAALSTQPFAAGLFLAVVAGTALAVAEVVQPRSRWSRLWSWAAPREGLLAGAFLLAMGAGWAYKIAWLSAGAAP